MSQGQRRKKPRPREVCWCVYARKKSGKITDVFCHPDRRFVRRFAKEWRTWIKTGRVSGQGKWFMPEGTSIRMRRSPGMCAK
jgi:hypothetical protein